MAWRQRRVQTPDVFVGAVAYAALMIFELFICSIGDVLDTLRHEFVFNGVSDLAVVFVVLLSSKVGE